MKKVAQPGVTPSGVEPGAEEGTRTPTELPTAPLTLRVYQFHHLGI